MTESGAAGPPGSGAAGGAFRGERCIVLRAAPEGAELTRELLRRGARAVHFPTLEIEPLPAPPMPDDSPDLAIFISQNAVRHGAPALARLAGAQVAAIGQGTAGALRAAGHPPQIVPVSGYTSEALLAHPELAAVQGRSVWIVRGVGGRALLATTLRARGAQVRFVEVYRRSLPVPSPAHAAEVAAMLRDPEPAWLLATSPEAFDNLFLLLGITGLRYRLVTSSDRVVQSAESRGGMRTVLRAPAPDHTALIETLLHWSRHSAASPDT